MVLAHNLRCLLQQELKYNTENDVKSAGQEHRRSESFITLTQKALPWIEGKLNIKYTINEKNYFKSMKHDKTQVYCFSIPFF